MLKKQDTCVGRCYLDFNFKSPDILRQISLSGYRQPIGLRWITVMEHLDVSRWHRI